MFGAEHIVSGKLTRPGAPLHRNNGLSPRSPRFGNTRCSAAGRQGAASGFAAAIPRGPIARPATCPYCPCNMSGPSSCEWDGTGACTWSVAMEAHPERASITKSVASDFRQFIAYSGPPDLPYLTRANDRLDRAGVIVLEVADPGAHRPTRHLFGRVGWITR